MRRNVIKEAEGGSAIIVRDMAQTIEGIHNSVYDALMGLPAIVSKYTGEGEFKLNNEDIPKEIRDAARYAVMLIKNLESLHRSLEMGAPLDPDFLVEKIVKQISAVRELFLIVQEMEPEVDLGPGFDSLESAPFLISRMSADMEERVGGAAMKASEMPASSYRSIDFARVYLLERLAMELEENLDLTRAERLEIRNSIAFLESMREKIDDIVSVVPVLDDAFPGLDASFALRELNALVAGVNRIPESIGEDIPELKGNLSEKLRSMIRRFQPRIMTTGRAPDEFINENSLYDRFMRRMFRD